MLLFQSGEIYLNNKTGRHIFVTEIKEDDDYMTLLSIKEVDPDTLQLLFSNEISINKMYLNDWELIEVV